MTLNDRELAAVLAGLRLLQQADEIGGLVEYSSDIATIASDAGDVLSDAEIDALCERLNGPDEPEPTDPVRRYLDCSTVHLRPEFAEELWDGLTGFTIIGESDHRRWVYIDEGTLEPDRLEDFPLPDYAQKIVRHALELGCDAICFDPDGYQLPSDFEIFDDEGQE